MKPLTLVLFVAFCFLNVVESVAKAETTDANTLLQEIQTAAPKSDRSIRESGEPSSDYGIFRAEEEKSRRLEVLSLIAAALISLLIVLRYLTRNGACNAATIVNGSGMVLVIYATILVVIIARAEQQLTAAIGILGAIVGYLFGATTRSSSEPTVRPPG